MKMKLFRKETTIHHSYVYILGFKILSYRRNLKKNLTEKQSIAILKKQFRDMAGYELNIDNPKTFNEKIQWLKLYYKNPLLTKCSDKVEVRQYVESKIGKKHLVPILGAYNSADEIDFDKLPNKFVLKVNWGSGQNIICTDKSKLNVNEAKEKLNKWMNIENNHYFNFLEWCYKNIKPKIIAEEFIESDEDLKDYKFMCYNGDPKNMFIVQNRNDSKKMTINFFDKDFTPLPFTRHYNSSKDNIEKPAKWDEMINLAKILSKPFPFVRVDFYINKGEINLGELTFYPGNGTERFNPIEWDLKLGNYLTLPEKTQW